MSTESNRIGFALTFSALSAIGRCHLDGEGTSKHIPTDSQRDLVNLGMLTHEGANTTPTKRGWRLLAALWEDPEEVWIGQPCRAADMAEPASLMATGKFQIVGPQVVRRIEGDRPMRVTRKP